MSASQSIVPKEDCCICLGEVENRGKIACEHKFCFDCIHNWSKVTNTCPICKLAFKRITAATSSTDKTVGTKRKAPPRDIQVPYSAPIIPIIEYALVYNRLLKNTFFFSYKKEQ